MAASMPRGMPTIHVIKITIAVKSSVLGILSFNLTETFSPAEV